MKFDVSLFVIINLFKFMNTHYNCILQSKLSDLCKIENPPSNPIVLFQQILKDYHKYVSPQVITMNLATVNKYVYSILKTKIN